MDSEWTKFEMKQDNRGPIRCPLSSAGGKPTLPLGQKNLLKKKKKKRKQVDYLPLTRLALKTVPDPFHLGRKFFLFFYFILFIFLKFYFIFRLYITVLVLPNIKMNPPQVYMCSPSRIPPPSSLPIPPLWVVPVRQPQASSIVH